METTQGKVEHKILIGERNYPLTGDGAYFTVSGWLSYIESTMDHQDCDKHTRNELKFFSLSADQDGSALKWVWYGRDHNEEDPGTLDLDFSYVPFQSSWLVAFRPLGKGDGFVVPCTTFYQYVDVNAETLIRADSFVYRYFRDTALSDALNWTKQVVTDPKDDL